MLKAYFYCAVLHRVAKSRVVVSKGQIDSIVERISRAGGVAETTEVSVVSAVSASGGQVMMLDRPDCPAEVTTGECPVQADTVISSSDVMQDRPADEDTGTHFAASACIDSVLYSNVTFLFADVI